MHGSEGFTIFIILIVYLQILLWFLLTSFVWLQMDPIVQAGHEGVVHHIVVYDCRDDYPDHHLNYTGRCYSSDMPPPVARCTGLTTIAAWAIGGNVGFMSLLVNQAQFVIPLTKQQHFIFICLSNLRQRVCWCLHFVKAYYVAERCGRVIWKYNFAFSSAIIPQLCQVIMLAKCVLTMLE